MKLYIYQGLDDEKVPKDTTRVIVDNSVTVIKRDTFYLCRHLVSVIMGDNVKRIEEWAFYKCHALRFIRLSNMLEFMGAGAFHSCHSLEALFLPSTVKSIEIWAFGRCRLLRLLILPNDINLRNVSEHIIKGTTIHQIAENVGVAYEYDEFSDVIDESNREVNEWLIHRMDEVPFHKLCCSSSIATQLINDHLNEYGNDSAAAIDPIHGMTPLHVLSMNPYAPSETIAALLNVNVEFAFRLDYKEKMSLDYARDYNVGGLIGMINGLCNYKNSSNPAE